MKATVSFYTLGCRLNQAETAILECNFERDGYTVVDFLQPADWVVINTCTVTENSEADTRQLVHKINRMNSRTKIALIGCQAQVQKEKLLELPGVFWVIGNASKMELPQILNQVDDSSTLVFTPAIPKESFTISGAGIDRRHTRANLKIQDGCDSFCSFCAVPYARGRARSRDFADLQRAARELVAAGHQELVLTGINVGSYQNQDKSIVEVISALENIEKLQRIRISSIEPTSISPTIIEKMASSPKFCRYLHLPLQSGNDEILQAMNRKYTTAEFVRFVWLVRQRIPDVCLGVDVIVGFPSETESHFAITYQLLQELPLSYFHVFSYSDRQQARSSRLVHKVPVKMIAERSRILRELSLRKRRAYLEGFVGKNERVLFEQKKDGYWNGLTDTYIRVRVKSEFDLQNQLLPVHLERIDKQSIIGSLS